MFIVDSWVRLTKHGLYGYAPHKRHEGNAVAIVGNLGHTGEGQLDLLLGEVAGLGAIRSVREIEESKDGHGDYHKSAQALQE